MNARTQESAIAEGYNFAYLDEQTKRMIRRALLKAVAIPGHQVPFASREMPLPYGWGTGGLQVTSAIIGRSDTLKVIDQGSDETTNAVNIRRFFARTAGIATTTRTVDASIIQTRHRIPETPLTDMEILERGLLMKKWLANPSDPSISGQPREADLETPATPEVLETAEPDS